MGVEQIKDMCRVAEELHAKGRFSEAAEQAEAALALCRDSLGRAHYAWPLTLCAAAACQVGLRNAKAAEALLEEAVERARAMETDDFEHARAVLTHAAELYGELGQHRTSRQLWQELIQLTGRELGIDHPRYFAARARLASAGDAQGPSNERT